MCVCVCACMLACMHGWMDGWMDGNSFLSLPGFARLGDGGLWGEGTG